MQSPFTLLSAVVNIHNERRSSKSKHATVKEDTPNIYPCIAVWRPGLLDFLIGHGGLQDCNSRDGCAQADRQVVELPVK